MHTVYPPKFCLTFVSNFSWLLGITVIPREIKDNRYATFWGGGWGGGKQGCIVVYVKMMNSLGHVRDSNPRPLAP